MDGALLKITARRRGAGWDRAAGCGRTARLGPPLAAAAASGVPERCPARCPTAGRERAAPLGAVSGTRGPAGGTRPETATPAAVPEAARLGAAPHTRTHTRPRIHAKPPPPRCSPSGPGSAAPPRSGRPMPRSPLRSPPRPARQPRRCRGRRIGCAVAGQSAPGPPPPLPAGTGSAPPEPGLSRPCPNGRRGWARARARPPRPALPSRPSARSGPAPRLPPHGSAHRSPPGAPVCQGGTSAAPRALICAKPAPLRSFPGRPLRRPQREGRAPGRRTRRRPVRPARTFLSPIGTPRRALTSAATRSTARRSVCSSTRREPWPAGSRSHLRAAAEARADRAGLSAPAAPGGVKCGRPAARAEAGLRRMLLSWPPRPHPARSRAAAALLPYSGASITHQNEARLSSK